ncbi:MAG: M56 family metallopeptidase, partial [Sphingobacteriaceae bacterium]
MTMMEINPFILALSKTLPESCLQSLVIYLLLQLLFFVDKRSTPLLRFNLFYAANWFLFIGFIFTFCYHYQQIQVKQFDVNLLQNISKNNIQALASKPNLWLQFNFWTNHYAYVITAFYLLGLLFCILKLTIGLINISWFRNNKNLKLDDYLTQLSIQLCSNFGLIKTVSVFVSDQISVPLTLGFIKPIIVFPIALINQLSAEQTEAILLHELAHIKRNDYLLNLLLCIIQSFLFFNPAIWLMKRETNKYREQCCDDLVLDNTQHKIAYAHALLLIEESRNTQLTLTLASNGKKYTLLNRIKRITDMKTNENLPQNKLVVLLLALIVVGLTVAWNIPVKKTIKNLSFTHFRVIKEALKK